MASPINLHAFLQDAADGNKLYVASATTFELYRTHTFITVGATSDVITVKSTGGFLAGSTVMVAGDGLNPPERTVSAVLSLTTLRLNATITTVAGALVMLRRTPAAALARTTMYASPDELTAIGEIVNPSDSELIAYLRTGRYCLRVGSGGTADTTLQIGPVVEAAETTFYVNPDHDSPTAGIQEAIDALPANKGKVKLGPYDYNLAATITHSRDVIIEGAGPESTMLRVLGNFMAAHISGAVSAGLRDLGIETVVANSTDVVWLEDLGNPVFDNVGIYSNGQANTGTGLFIDHCIKVHPRGEVTTGAAGGGTFTNLVKINWSDTVTLSGLNLNSGTNGVNVVDTEGPTSGLLIAGCDFNALTNGIVIARGLGANNVTVLANAWGTVTNRIVTTGGSGNSPNFLFQSARPAENDSSLLYFDGLLVSTAATQALAAAGDTLNPAKRNILRVTATGDFVLSATPTIADGTDGQELLLLNVDLFDATQNEITLQDESVLVGSNLRLRTPTVILGTRDSILLRFDAFDGSWGEIHRDLLQTAGTATILTGTTSIVVTHNQPLTPTADQITVTPTNNPTNALTTGVWISAITGTTFTINRNDPGASGATFSWRIRR